ncbi:NUDIX hydrolase [Cytobacillus solani]|uniref:DNA mismatch repair protein MutT n=1 Tax=Cytobacillus solani TaxID=1637975 RepID=A0A0Q3VFX5_9BACI|nr:NUDIX hydrolase [Cytobacillus solani]KOP81207.1 DNA mismatch repair protein MutT [Bacillus sp. FJAT-21945]KQL18219.1 DNA mismatch repair protein MutT [Cytobacillus solani]USK56061.1 NUDIX hydrolase [Cytobacillus solani]
MMWEGSAAICINEKDEILMVAQEKPNEPELWSVPSGGVEENETFEECCAREVFEETGYRIKVIKKVHERDGITYKVDVHVKYFEVQLIGGEKKIQDPDQLILDISWIPISKISEIKMLFEEEREILLNYLQGRN